MPTRKFIDNYGYQLALALFILWMCFGIFPLHCYESDSMHVIAGCEIMYNQGWQMPPLWTYEYRMQPLITLVVVALKYVCPILTCEQIYCLLSAVCAIIFLIESLKFVQAILPSINKYEILFAAFLLPEVYAIAMYANSAIPAAALLAIALNLILKGRNIPALILMGIAPLFRLDVVAVYPAIFPLFIFKGYGWKKSLVLSTVFAIFVVLIAGIGYALAQTNPLSAFGGYESWNQRLAFSKIVIAIFGFYSISYLILLPAGIYFTVKQKLFKALFLGALPIVLLHFVYRSMGCAAKHYLYIVPFVLLFGAIAIDHIIRLSKRIGLVRILSGTFLFLYLLCSITVDFPSKPARNQSYSETKLGPGMNISHGKLSKYNFACGFGAGQLVVTLDEYMLASGELFYPFYIHRIKENRAVPFEDFNKAMLVRPKKQNIIVSLTWEDEAIYPNYLAQNGYTFDFDKTKKYRFILSKGKSHYFETSVELDANLIADDLIPLLGKQLDEYSHNKGCRYIFMTSIDKFKYVFEKMSKKNLNFKKVNSNFYYYEP